MGYTYVYIDHKAQTAETTLELLSEKEGLLEVARARDYEEGLEIVLETKPDLLFVRIEEGAALNSLVNQLHQFLVEMPLLVGLSSEASMAYPAIKLGFFDLMLLPFRGVDLNKTLLRLQKTLPATEKSPTLCLKTYSDFHYLQTDEILYLKADNNTTDFHMRNGKIISAYKTLKSYESALPDNFIRVHQSYIINRDYVSRINYRKNQCSIRDREPLPFSRSYKPKVDQLKELLTKNAIRTMS